MNAFMIAAMLAVSAVGSVAGCEMACPTALAEGVLVADGENLALRATTGETDAIAWPSGYSVRQENGRLVLADRFGTVKARDGDRIGVGGGVGVDDLFHGCGDVWVEAPNPAG